MQDSEEVLERFHGNLPLVEPIARGLRRATESSVDLQELLSFGREGLLDASRRYDADRGVPFRGYARIRVKGAMIDGMRQAARLPRRIYQRLIAIQAANEFSAGALEDLSAPRPPGARARDAEEKLQEHLAGMVTAMVMGLVAEPTPSGDFKQPEQDTPEQQASLSELSKLLRQGIETLPVEEAELVRRHYFDGDQFDRIAEQMGVSKSWASRLHTRAIKRLSKRVQV